MNGTRNEKILAQERLHPAVFMIPVLTAAVAALPPFFAVLMFHTFTTIISNLFAQITRQPINLFSNYYYIFAFVPTVLTAGPVLLITFFAYRKSVITLTNRRLSYRTGFVSIATGELPLENVDAVFTEDPLLGRMFGYGTVMVTSVGGLRLPFHYLRSPNHFHHILNKAVNAARGGEAPQSGSKSEVPLQNDDLRYMPKG